MPSLARPAVWTIHFKNTKQDTGLCQILTDLLACSNVWSDLVMYVAVSWYQFWQDSSVGDLFRTICCSKQSVHHLLPPLRKWNARHGGHHYRNFQICGRRIDLVSIQLTTKSTIRPSGSAVYEWFDAACGVWAGVVQNAIGDVIQRRNWHKLVKTCKISLNLLLN